MNVLVFVDTYRGGAAHRWHRLSGKGGGDGTSTAMVYHRAMRAALEAAFARAVAGRGGWRFGLVPAVRETLVAAAARGAAPDAVIEYYTRRMPAILVEQLAADDPAARLLFRPLGHTPRLRAALDALGALAREEDLDLPPPGDTIAATYAPTFFASGMPLLGAFPAERALISAELAGGADPDAVIDLRLSGNLVHEVCHGRARELDRPPPPWMLLEAAALHLGMTARPEHFFPETPGEAVPGVSLFGLAGQGLARLLGRGALWSLIGGASLEDAAGGAAPALEAAGWEAWLARRAAPFVADALDAETWIKLADAARAGRALTLEAAARTPWPELPWWAEEPTAADREMAATAVRALFQVNVLAPTFQTHPSEPPGGRLELDVAACRLAAAVRPDGVFAEPARWIFPPSLARILHARGARRVIVEGAARAKIGAIAAALLDEAGGALPEITRIGV
jgi:hypothetical protein